MMPASHITCDLRPAAVSVSWQGSRSHAPAVDSVLGLPRRNRAALRCPQGGARGKAGTLCLAQSAAPLLACGRLGQAAWCALHACGRLIQAAWCALRAVQLYSRALGSVFEEEQWGPLEYTILAKHFERHDQRAFAYHAVRGACWCGPGQVMLGLALCAFSAMALCDSALCCAAMLVHAPSALVQSLRPSPPVRPPTVTLQRSRQAQGAVPPACDAPPPVQHYLAHLASAGHVDGTKPPLPSFMQQP